MELNVLKYYPYRKRYYLTHPWKFISQTFDNFRAGWQRIVKGYANRDVWDLDHYWLDILSHELRFLAENGSAYPGTEPFETPEKWHQWLNGIADRLDALQEDWAESRNEYEQQYFKAMEEYRTVSFTDTGAIITTYNDDDIKELHDRWLARMDELNEAQMQETIDVFEELGRHWYLLWD